MSNNHRNSDPRFTLNPSPVNIATPSIQKGGSSNDANNNNNHNNNNNNNFSSSRVPHPSYQLNNALLQPSHESHLISHDCLLYRELISNVTDYLTTTSKTLNRLCSSINNEGDLNTKVYLSAYHLCLQAFQLIILHRKYCMY
jgi:hypothetical protein